MQSDDAADAMKFDGVRPETMVMLVSQTTNAHNQLRRYGGGRQAMPESQASTMFRSQ